MECNRIKIQNFRNIEEADITFDPGVNILYGNNAQGKTNLLEAIGFTAFGKSFRTSHDEEMIRFGAEFAEISMDFTDSVRRQNITVRMMSGKRRRIEQNKVKIGKLSDIVGAFRTVLFCPEHLSLIKDGPGKRRSFIDGAICQLRPYYASLLNEFNQLEAQRAALLKQRSKKYFDPSLFDVWNERLAAVSAKIACIRADYIKNLIRFAPAHFHTLFHQ